MSKKKSGVNYSKTAPVISRRERVIELLEAQLKSGVKAIKIDGVDTTAPLEEKDINRIKGEVKTLKARI
jgi:hypothetical protein